MPDVYDRPVRQDPHAACRRMPDEHPAPYDGSLDFWVQSRPEALWATSASEVAIRATAASVHRRCRTSTA